jgi:hypothetical protein
MRSIFRYLFPLLLTPTVAFGDWQNTNWGMSMSQVASLTGAHLATPEEQAKWTISRTGEAPGLATDYISGRLPFKAVFYFDQARGLQKVTLHLNNYSQKPELVESVIGKYGPPFDKNISSFGVTMHWIDKSNNLLIDMYDMAAIQSASVIYHPARDRSSSGL